MASACSVPRYARFLLDSLHLVRFPAVAGAVFGFNFLRDALRDQIDPRAVWKWGYEKPMVIVKKGDCEHCGRLYRYSLWHSGFGDNSYAYCDDCGMLALLNYSNPYVAGFPPLSVQFAEIDASWESFLQPCVCSGRFRKNASPRCPHCNEKLSPTHAAAHIEAQATGAGRDWKWQKNWSGVYCMMMDNAETPGYPRQMIDPIHQPEMAKSRSRWSLLFSFGR